MPRRDLTDLPFVTIDGADAKDFDDAVCARKTRSGWTLWVAIADVAHYVRPGSALDAEARKRGTSVYFPNRVIPMLPPELSRRPVFPASGLGTQHIGPVKCGLGSRGGDAVGPVLPGTDPLAGTADLFGRGAGRIQEPACCATGVSTPICLRWKV